MRNRVERILAIMTVNLNTGKSNNYTLMASDDKLDKYEIKDSCLRITDWDYPQGTKGDYLIENEIIIPLYTIRDIHIEWTKLIHNSTKIRILCI